MNSPIIDLAQKLGINVSDVQPHKLTEQICIAVLHNIHVAESAPILNVCYGAEVPMSIIKQIMAEYDEAKDDASFPQGHPIFQMAQHIDLLRAGWIEFGTPEDIDIKGEEILLWDGADYHIDYVDIDVDSGCFYLANGTEATHYKALTPP